jgi:hypothetical protein
MGLFFRGGKEMEKKKYVPGDIIAGIFFYLEAPYFTGDIGKIHATIFEAKEKFKILKAFPFSVEDVSPFSRRLEDVLNRLELSRVIGMENPDFTRFLVKEKSKKYLEERIIPLFDDREKEQLRSIAAIFKEKCSA